MENIEQRLEALERRCRRAQWSNRVLAFALAVVVCAAGAQLSAPQTPKTSPPADGQQRKQSREGKEGLQTVEAERIVLRDAAGQPRLTMTVTEDGPAISMFDELGFKKLELSQSAERSGIRLFDSHKTQLASLEVQDRDRPELVLNDADGRALIHASGFEVRDREDRSRALLALINGNFPVLGLNKIDQKGPPSVELTAGDNGMHAFKIHDAAGRPLFVVSATKGGVTHLHMRHPDHERLLQISAGPKNEDGPQVAFFDSANPDGTGGQLARLRLGLQRDGEPYIRIIDRDGNAIFTAPKK
ncbi:MAG: hypothetical protein ACTHK7_16550 [Aureliella sp.]